MSDNRGRSQVTFLNWESLKVAFGFEVKSEVNLRQEPSRFVIA